MWSQKFGFQPVSKAEQAALEDQIVFMDPETTYLVKKALYVKCAPAKITLTICFDSVKPLLPAFGPCIILNCLKLAQGHICKTVTLFILWAKISQTVLLANIEALALKCLLALSARKTTS